ncbi:hypothetical protein AB3N59_12045 [Leptospira sp. WS92.C1]
MIRLAFFLFFLSCASSKENILVKDGQKKRLLIDKFNYLENQKLKPFATGLASTLTNGLARIPSLDVIGPAEKANTLKLIQEKQLFGEDVDPVEFLSKITAADYFCNGDIQTEQETALVNVRISDAKHGNLILNTATRGILERPITLQDKVMENLLSNIDGKNTEFNKSFISKSSTKNAVAFSNYVQAFDILYTNPQRAAVFLINALKEDPEYLDALEDLSNILFQLGDSKKALGFLWKKKEILDRRGLQNTLDYTNTLFNLGVVHFSLGEREKGIQFCVQDKELKETLKLKSRKPYATTLQTLGAFYIYQKKYKQGIIQLESARNVLLSLGLDKTFDYADLLTSLGSAYKQSGDFQIAASLYQDAGSIFKELGLTSTSSYAALLTNQGALHSANGEYKEALKKFIQDKEIQNKLGLIKTEGYVVTPK